MRSHTIETRTNSIPVRAILALIGTALALILLVSFKTPDKLPPANLAIAPVSSAAGPTGRAAADGSSAGGAAGTPPPQATDGSRGTASVAQSRRGTSQATATPAPPPLTATPATGTTGTPATVDGPVVQTQFGDVQVEIQVAGGKIVDVQALQLPSDRRRSQAISNYVAPVLRSEALQAQSAQIDQVSGATYTSGAYAQSLQGAIDKAHV